MEFEPLSIISQCLSINCLPMEIAPMSPELEPFSSEYLFGARAGAFKFNLFLAELELGGFWLKLFQNAELELEVPSKGTS